VNSCIIAASIVWIFEMALAFLFLLPRIICCPVPAADVDADLIVCCRLLSFFLVSFISAYYWLRFVFIVLHAVIKDLRDSCLHARETLTCMQGRLACMQERLLLACKGDLLTCKGDSCLHARETLACMQESLLLA